MKNKDLEMSKKNIVYILSDQHNSAIMANAGDEYIRTPNIDSIFEKGTSLENCYCASPLCVPSRSAILSGLLPTSTGVYNNMQSLSTCKATFVNSLTVGGYETVLSGRMHFVGWDQRHGFEKRFVGDITPCFVGADNEREIYGDFMRSSGQNRISIEKSGAGHSAVLDFDRDVVDSACNYLKERTDERPLFMTVGFYGPHCPYVAPKELFDYYYEKLPEIPFFDLEEKAKMHPAIQKWYENRNLEEITPEDVRRIRAAYYSLVEMLDGYVGEILKTVEDTIGLKDTIIIYGSDHGDNIGEHGLFWKTNFYEGASKVPMVFLNEELFEAGKSIKANTSLLDVAPTIIDLAMTPQLPKYDGISLTKYLQGNEVLDEERPIISICSDIKGDMPSAMLRKGKFKLIAHAGYEDFQLFDLEKDPNEQIDLGCNDEYKDIIKKLSEELFSFWDSKEAEKQLADSKIHFQLMKDWFNITKPEIIEEWRGDSSRNYLCNFQDTNK